MERGKGILLYLLIFILAISVNSALCCPDYTSTDKSSAHYTYIHEGHFVQSCFSERSTGQDWVKIRYMGGYCRYDASNFSITVYQPVHADKATGGSYASFASSWCCFSSALRGPPQSKPASVAFNATT